MNKTLIVAALLAATPAGAAATDPAAPQAETAVSDVEVTAKVVSVDRVMRTVTVQDEAGNTMRLRVPRDIDLRTVKTGARLNVRYTQAVAMEIAKPNTHPPVESESQMREAPGSGAPSAREVTTKEIVATIQDIDRNKRQMTLKGPEGDTLTVAVPPGTPGFDDARVGDSTYLRYTEAAALSIQPPTEGGDRGQDR